jgi:hypothetical protein
MSRFLVGGMAFNKVFAGLLAGASAPNRGLRLGPRS